ncbi:MAG: hypothetical protein QM791_10920 [Ferruginibacter sp.]
MTDISIYLYDSGLQNNEKPLQHNSYFKEGLPGLPADRKCGYFEMPENNFFKDDEQMEKEFRDEAVKSKEHIISEYFLLLDGKVISAEEVLSRPMEENY